MSQRQTNQIDLLNINKKFYVLGLPPCPAPLFKEPEVVYFCAGWFGDVDYGILDEETLFSIVCFFIFI